MTLKWRARTTVVGERELSAHPRLICGHATTRALCALLRVLQPVARPRCGARDGCCQVVAVAAAPTAASRGRAAAAVTPATYARTSAVATAQSAAIPNTADGSLQSSAAATASPSPAPLSPAPLPPQPSPQPPSPSPARPPPLAPAPPVLEVLWAASASGPVDPYGNSTALGSAGRLLGAPRPGRRQAHHVRQRLGHSHLGAHPAHAPLGGGALRRALLCHYSHCRLGCRRQCCCCSCSHHPHHQPDLCLAAGRLRAQPGRPAARHHTHRPAGALPPAITRIDLLLLPAAQADAAALVPINGFPQQQQQQQPQQPLLVSVPVYVGTAVSGPGAGLQIALVTRGTC